jgi:group II intron reverse transcriptase/maturase
MSLETPDKVRDLQQALAGRSKFGGDGRFYSLYDKVYRMDVLWEAWRRVKANRGASGVDGQDIEAVEAGGVDSFLSDLAEELRTKRYRPAPLRRVWIPKSDGKKRPLGIPTVKDRVAQQAVRLVMEPIFEVRFSKSSYGFRPERGCQQAILRTRQLLNWGLVHVIEADVVDCFGSIPHRGLMKAVARRIADKSILRIIHLWLTCGVLEQGRWSPTSAGTPQGGVISPLLANIYLDALDRRWKRRQMSSRAGHNAHLVRYADDLVILTDKGTEEPFRVLSAMLKKLGLALHPGKTRILDARQDDFDFLGFNLRKMVHPRSGKWWTLLQPSHKAQLALQEKVRMLTSSHRSAKVGEVVREVNPVVRGWVNYFRIGNSSRVFQKIRHFVGCRIRRYIRRRQNRHGYGWKAITSDFLYGALKLFYDYRVVNLRFVRALQPAWGLG